MTATPKERRIPIVALDGKQHRVADVLETIDRVGYLAVLHDLPVPTKRVRTLAKELVLATGLSRITLAPSERAGLVLTFAQGDKNASVAYMNNRRILLVAPKMVDVSQAEVLEKMRAFCLS